MPRASVGDSPDSAPLTAGLWEQAEFTAPLTGPIVDGVSPPSETGPWTTRAKFAWDPGHLYMLVESVGPRPSSPFTRHDELLHQADAIELFLDVTGNRRRIVEVQVNPGNVTADYLHVWDRKPTYPAHRIDADFYRAHHRADLAWDVRGLRTRSVLAPAGDGLTRWTVLMAVPLSEILAADGLTTPLRPGQTLYVNVMRYAYTGEDNRRTLRHYNLVPVRQGCPHQSPMATMELTAVE
ncbi:MAG TPA: hypothetical protein DCX07_03885 [Phycisphaerales bacterium]|nr:hypothetical protein [Phycisphaerales bacterium]